MSGQEQLLKSDDEYATINVNETVILLTAHIASPSIVSRLYSTSSTKRDVSIPEGKEHIVITALYRMEMDGIGLYDRNAARFVQRPSPKYGFLSSKPHSDTNPICCRFEARTIVFSRQCFSSLCINEWVKCVIE